MAKARRIQIHAVRLTCTLAAGILFASMIGGASLASASTSGWMIRSNAEPQNLPPGGTGTIYEHAVNLGSASANAGASPIRISETLPAGVTVTSIGPAGFGAGVSLSCSVSTVSCEGNAGEVLSYQEIEIIMNVSVSAGISSGTTGTIVASVSGGGAPPRANSSTVSFNTASAGFQVEQLEQGSLNEDGSPDTQAGSHPYAYTTTMQLDGREAVLPKDLHFYLPPGVIGNPLVVPQCTDEQFATRLGVGGNPLNACPNDTAIGVADISLGDEFPGSVVPLFNLTPNVGEPARFAFSVLGAPVFLDTAVRTGGDYGVVVSVSGITTVLGFTASQVTFWGAPSAAIHDNSRGWSCILNGQYREEEEVPPCPVSSPGAGKAPPFLTLPTSCQGPLHSSVEADSWLHQGEYVKSEYTWHDAAGPLQLDGCNRLPFEPSIAVTPDGTDGSTPTGLAVTEHIPQEDTLNPTGLGESDVKTTTVALPAGVAISPSGGDGLMACSMEQVGFTGPSAGGGLEFTHEEVTCPEASKVGTVRIETPLLPNPLRGAVYLAQQNTNPFGSLLALYVVAKEPISGVLVKAAGETTLNPVTGQLTTTFKNTPQLPYENLELHFFGSARAPLTTPDLCGAYTTTTAIEGWSENPPAEPTSTFNITSGPAGAPCSNPLPFTPGFQAGSLNLQAGAFTPFELTMSRPDGNQTLSRVELQMPPGLLGTLSTVKLCPEPQAAQGTCGEDSLIGHTTVSAGLGDSPYTVVGGKVFVTTGYKGAPYGLSIVNPAKAGPFDLGTVVVRAQIRVDPHDAHLTIVSDALPTILDGIPLQIQEVQVAVERPEGFTFNATNCEPLQITGTLTSTEGVASKQSRRYQITNCLALAFKPSLTASTSGKTSRKSGASLNVKLGYQAGPYDTNIARVKVELPRALPSKLTTLQKACTAAVFEANPANCPAPSIIGHATATTPVLPVPLSGPAYFVSHGSESFPSLIIVLQGYGATVELVGATFIDKSGVTSSTFKTIPDVPVGTFELNLPEGSFSALAANGNLCKKKLVMPTEFVAQNGLVLHQQTKIQATGCPNAAKPARHKKSRKTKHRRTHKRHH